MTIRTLIVDDEKLAIQGMQLRLEPQLQALNGEFLVVDDKRAYGHALVPRARCPGKLVTEIAAVGF